MPIETDTDAWADAEPVSSIESDLLAFLRKNDSWAFHAREMADQVLDTNWSMVHRREREIQEVGEEEFHRRLEAGEYDGEFDVESGSVTIANSIKTQSVIAILHSFVREGLVEVRRVSVEETDIPYEDWDEVEYFSLAEE